MNPSSDAWKLPSSAEACAECGAPLAVGEVTTACIRFGDEGPTREDRCEGCGQAVEGEDVIFWRAARPADADKRPVVDYELLREIFERLRTRSDAASGRLSYLVGLVLVRKKVLRLKTFEVRGGREVMIVSRGKDQEPFEVPAPSLSAEDVVQVRDQLGRLLRADLSDLDDLGDEATRDTAAG